jgi:hypothetical protein
MQPGFLLWIDGAVVQQTKSKPTRLVHNGELTVRI